jgi:hypothetical protein
VTKGTTKNGQPLVKGKCPECNRTLTKFVSKKEQSAAAPAESKKKSEAPSKSKKVTPDMEELPKSKPKLVRTKAKKQVIEDDSD